MINKSFLLKNIKSYRRNSIFLKNFIAIFIIVSLLLTAICSIFGITSIRSAKKEIWIYNQNLTDTFSQAVMNEVKTIEYLALNLVQQDSIKYFLQLSSNPNPNRNYETETFQYIKSLIYVYKEIDSIYLYNEQNDSIYINDKYISRNNFADSGWLEAYKNTDNSSIILRANNNKYPYYLSIIAPVYLSAGYSLGCIVINLNIESIIDKIGFSNYDNNQYFYIVNENGEIIYSSDTEFITRHYSESEMLSQIIENSTNTCSTIRYNNAKFNISQSVSERYSWTYYYATEQNLFGDSLKGIILLIVLLLLISIFIGVVLALYITLKTYQPIQSISEAFDSLDSNSDNQYPDTVKNETIDILLKIAKILNTNRHYREELEAQRILLKHTHTMALQAQINPHFLFNTLDNINWMAITLTSSRNNVSDSLSMLSDMFRSNIDISNYMRTVEEEINYTKNYIEIIKLRFKDKFSIEWNIPEDIFKYKVPKLTLQPIIENAISHGIKKKRTFGTITIQAMHVGPYIQFKISDDGAGIDKNVLDTLNHELAAESSYATNHVGLKNVNQRIKLIFEGSCGIHLDSIVGKGTTVTVKILAIT